MTKPIKVEGLRIARANESIFAVSGGLDVKSGDTVLSVGCSGDYAFKFLEDDAARVYTKDISNSQTKYINLRIDALKRGDLIRFSCLNVTPGNGYEEYISQRQLRDAYFADQVNCRLIASRLNRLIVLNTGDLVKRKEELVFNKLYLSNILTTLGGRNMAELLADLRAVSRGLTSGGLIYSSAARGLWKDLSIYYNYTLGFHLTDEGITAFNDALGGEFEVNKELTVRARILEGNPWDPIVLTKRSGS